MHTYIMWFPKYTDRYKEIQNLFFLMLSNSGHLKTKDVEWVSYSNCMCYCLNTCPSKTFLPINLRLKVTVGNSWWLSKYVF